MSAPQVWHFTTPDDALACWQQHQSAAIYTNHQGTFALSTVASVTRALTEHPTWRLLCPEDLQLLIVSDLFETH